MLLKKTLEITREIDFVRASRVSALYSLNLLAIVLKTAETLRKRSLLSTAPAPVVQQIDIELCMELLKQKRFSEGKWVGLGERLVTVLHDRKRVPPRETNRARVSSALRHTSEFTCNMQRRSLITGNVRVWEKQISWTARRVRSTVIAQGFVERGHCVRR